MIEAIHGDSREVLRNIQPNTYHSIVTDPPYALISITKRFGKASQQDPTQTSDRARYGTDCYARLSKGFMGQEWDNGQVAFDPTFWVEVLRVAKPGAWLAAFGGTRTYHRLACAIEDAGWELRDCIMWVYGSGFPKSHSVSKGIDKHLGAQREQVQTPMGPTGNKYAKGLGDPRPWMEKAAEIVGYHEHDSSDPATPQAAEWDGWGTALKPAWEPILLARKPLDGTVAANTLQHGTGGINIDACRVEGVKPQVTQGINSNPSSFNVTSERRISGDPNEGRWPANLIHDGSPEVLDCFPTTSASKASFRGDQTTGQHGGLAGAQPNIKQGTNTVRDHSDDGGSAARFFYCAKASKKDRDGSKHPTVKPINLLRYICRLLTPPNGLILDPFAGSGTTGVAAHEEGFNATLIEREDAYYQDIQRRIESFGGSPLAAEMEIA